jgi:hypothetical protein
VSTLLELTDIGDSRGSSGGVGTNRRSVEVRLD